MRVFSKKIAYLFHVLLLIITTTITSFYLSYASDDEEEDYSLAELSVGALLDEFLSGKADFFSGVDVTGSSYYGSAGATWAENGALDKPGWRLRVAGGTGQYRYDGNVDVSGNSIPIRFLGDVSSFDVLLGYQYHYERLVLKGFLGANYIEHVIGPEDPDNSVQGTAWGVKGQAELWWSIDEKKWLSADLAYATSFGDFWSQLRFGFDVLPWVSLGPELAGLGHQDYSAGRAGGFVRFKTDYADITLSGGVSGNYEDDVSAYGSLGVYQKF